jgi:hypothetical protein
MIIRGTNNLPSSLACPVWPEISDELGSSVPRMEKKRYSHRGQLAVGFATIFAS